jgi:hypothetical protein
MLSLETLEDRSLPNISFSFHYPLGGNFFDENKRAILKSVADIFSEKLTKNVEINIYPEVSSLPHQEGGEANANGELKFSNLYDWHIAGPIQRDQVDFQSVALHEFMHILGVGTAPQWFNKISEGYFNGWLRLTEDHFHAISDSITTPNLNYGEIKNLTENDWRILNELGWNENQETGDSGQGQESAVSSQQSENTKPNPISLQPLIYQNEFTGYWLVVNSDFSWRVFQYGARGWIPLFDTLHNAFSVYDPVSHFAYSKTDLNSGFPDYIFQIGV